MSKHCQQKDRGSRNTLVPDEQYPTKSCGGHEGAASPLHINLCLMKNFVRLTNKNGTASLASEQNFLLVDQCYQSMMVSK